jgi:ribose transport system permease protein
MAVTVAVRGRAAQAARAVFAQDYLGVLVSTVLLVVVVGIRDPAFLNVGQLADVLAQAALVGLMACAMTYLLAMRELDLSVGSVFGLTAVCAALLTRSGVNPWLAAAAGVAAGAAFGMVNALLVDLLRLPSIIATLATLSMYRGLAVALSDGKQVLGAPVTASFSRFAGARPLGVPVNVWALVAVAAVLSFALRTTRFGHRVRSVGSNPEAAVFSGIPVRAVRIAAFVMVGAVAGLAGVLNLGFFGTADPNAGTGDELTAIAAAVIGGTPLRGGRASVTGAALGAALLGVVGSALAYFRIPINWNSFATGAVILAAVAVDSVLRGRSRIGSRP